MDKQQCSNKETQSINEIENTPFMCVSQYGDKDIHFGVLGNSRVTPLFETPLEVHEFFKIENLTWNKIAGFTLTYINSIEDVLKQLKDE